MHSPVSVVIPCYRCADTIARAVESVMRQTLPPKEVILVEDCSNDEGKTLAELHRLQLQYKQEMSIKVIPLATNVGPGEARNTGWNEASQPYIAFLDADDSWHSKKLEVQYQWMETHASVDLTCHQSMRAKGGGVDRILSDEIRVKRIQGSKLLFSNRIPTRSVMLRRKSIPYRFDIKKRHSEDYYLWLRILLNGYEAWRIELPLAYSYKAEFGDGGLTADLWKMEKGELDTYRRIYLEGLISFIAYLGVMLLSILKYLKRVAISFVLYK